MRRPVEMGRWHVQLWIVLIAVSIVPFALFGIQYRQQENENIAARHDTCVAIQNLNRVIVQSLERSEKNLPRIAYYKTHPKDLRIAKDEIVRELRVFRPRTCK